MVAVPFGVRILGDLASSPFFDKFFYFFFLKLLELLLETKANGCVRDVKHKTPLHLAADRGTARQVKVLTQTAPSCVWMRDDQRRTPLHYAVMSMKRYSFLYHEFDHLTHAQMGCIAVMQSICYVNGSLEEHF